MKMEKVLFISAEDDEDLIVSFVTPGGGYGEGNVIDVKSLILLRSPKFEFALYEYERGVNVSYGELPDDEYDLLEQIEFRSDAVHIKTPRRTYDFDISGVDDDEIADAKKVLEKMNFDGGFDLETV